MELVFICKQGSRNNSVDNREVMDAKWTNKIWKLDNGTGNIALSDSHWFVKSIPLMDLIYMSAILALHYTCCEPMRLLGHIREDTAVVHEAISCGYKSFKLVSRCHQLQFGFLANGHLPQKSRQLMMRVIMRWYRELCTDLLAFTLLLRKTPESLS